MPNIPAVVIAFSPQIYPDAFVMTPEQCLAARNLLGWTPADLAQAAGVSAITVRQFEEGRVDDARRAPAMMRRALEGAGVRFPAGLCANGTVRLRSP